LAPTDRVSALAQCQTLCDGKPNLAAPHGAPQWYLLANYGRGYDALAEYVLGGFTLGFDEEPDEPSEPPVFRPTHIAGGLQAGIGAKFRLNNWIGVDIGLTAGSGTVSQESRGPFVRQAADVQLLGGHIATKIYPLQSSAARIEPWLSAGARGLAVRPTRGVHATERFTIDNLDGRRFRASSIADFASGAGVDLNLTRRSGMTAFAEHGYRTGWRVGIALNFRLSVKPPVSNVPYWPKTDSGGS
jgi:hypothetical protein